MKTKNLTIFRRFAIVIFSLITVLGILFIIITYLSTTYYHEASTQLLNKEVSAHIAEFTSPFTESGINRKKADSVFNNAMILSPGAEVYFLDSTGKVIYFHASEKEIKQWNVDLVPIKKYIATHGEQYIKASDPKDPGHTKIFSAAEVHWEKKILGYIYVILDSKKSESIMDTLFGNHILKLAVQAFVIIILLSFLFSILYLRKMRKNFRQMIDVLNRFENGDYSARFQMRQYDELEPVTNAFNKMADLLSSAINKLTKSEQDRKNFIATISHDLRTPLSIARGYTETLLLKKEKGGITGEEQEYYAQLVYHKLFTIENMVKQLFDLSKMDAVEFKPEKEPFVFSEIVQETINNFRLMASAKNIQLNCNGCVHITWIDADVSMIERVIQNLLDNALKNTPEGGAINATINTLQNDVTFKIENTGTPLTTDLLQWINGGNHANIFSENRPQKQGLGLIIVQKILQLHGTSLNASVNKGSNIFSFSLPVYKIPV